MMINKENQKRKMEDSKKDRRRKINFRIFKDRQWRSIESRRLYRKRKRQKRIGSEKTKIKKYMFHLENTKQQRKEGRKRRNGGLHDITGLGRYPQETQEKDRKTES